MDSIRPRNFNEYLDAFRRHKMAILVPAIVVMIASAIAIKRMPNIFESSTFIVIESPKSESAAGDTSLDLSQRLTTIKQQVTSRSSIEAVINKFGLYKNELQKGARLDDVIADVRDQVSVEVPPNPENVTKAFSISFRDQNPEVAQQVTAELADQLIRNNVEAIQKNVSGEAQILNQRAEELSAQLHELEVSHPWLLTLRKDMPIIPMFGSGGSSNAASVAKANADAARAHNMSVESLKDQQEKLEKQLAEVEKSIAELKPIVEQQKKISPMPGNAAYGALIAKRAELVGQRDDMLKNQGYTEKHPKVLNVNEQIAALDRQIEDLKRQAGGVTSQTAEALQLRQLETQRTQLKIDLEITHKAVARQMANPPQPMAVTTAGGNPGMTETPATKDAGSARIAQDYLGMKTDYEQVMAKKQDVELKEKTVGSSKVEQYRVIDQASVPQLPVAPNRKVMMLIAAILGLAVGAVFAGVLEFRRFASLQDSKDVEYYTKLPMLAAIPKTLTAEDQKREARQRQRKIFLGTVAAVLAVFVLTGVFMFTNFFSLLIRK
ncbi:MAG: GNVR domain-containing protein [Acidobacteriota bacterium]